MAPAPVSRLLRRLKLAVTASCALLGLLVLARLWSVDGLLRRVTIDGPSMVPAYCGTHYKIQCGDCGFSFSCDAEHLPTDRRAACPNCGFGENSLEGITAAPPDRVLIDRWPVIWQGLKRGHVVAFQSPDSNGDLAVKRVVGLPGERLVIEYGDLMSGRRLLRKEATEFRALRLLVHDNNYLPRKTPGLPARWRAANTESRWKPIGSGFRIEPSTADDSDMDWLRYHHWPCTANPRLRGVAAAISDNDSFNQGETHRPLNPVSDVFLSCRLQTFGTGRFTLAAIDGDQRFEVEIEPRKQVVLSSGGQAIVTQPLKHINFSRNPVAIEFGLCDQQVMLAIDGRTVLRYDYERRGNNTSQDLHPLSIGAASIGLQVNDLRVWRDIFYLDPQGLPRHWSAATLAAEQFIVLGDNQPVSIDSRHWESPAVARNYILGRVYRPFWTAQ